MSRAYAPRPPRDALAWTAEWAPVAELERLPLAEAAGRVLAQAIVARDDVPAVALSGCDGHALRAADTLGAGSYNPLPLRIRDAVGELPRGCAALVSSGDPLPAGADAVLPLELSEARGGELEVTAPLAPSEGVVPRAQECRAGEELYAAGRRLRPQDLARLALAGCTGIAARRRPRVRIVLAGRFAIDANGPMLAALVARDGGADAGVQRAAQGAALAAALGESGADLVLSCGGTGYGAADAAVAALASCGSVELDGVAIHPGGGIVLGRTAGGTPVALLPGTPLAALCAYDLIAGRVLRRLAGLPPDLPYCTRRLRLRRKIVSSIGQLELARVRIEGDAAVPLATAEGRSLATAARADGFVVVPEHSEGFPTDSNVDVYLYERPA